jgi:hypothetical protein
MTQLNIQKVTNETVEVSGQPLARAYAETVMLPMLIAGCAQDFSKSNVILEQFDSAGLCLKAAPSMQLNRFYMVREEQAQAAARRQRDADDHAARCLVPTIKDIATKKAEREAKAASVRSHFASLRAQKGGSTGW